MYGVRMFDVKMRVRLPTNQPLRQPHPSSTIPNCPLNNCHHARPCRAFNYPPAYIPLTGVPGSLSVIDLPPADSKAFYALHPQQRQVSVLMVKALRCSVCLCLCRHCVAARIEGLCLASYELHTFFYLLCAYLPPHSACLLCPADPQPTQSPPLLNPHHANNNRVAGATWCVQS